MSVLWAELDIEDPAGGQLAVLAAGGLELSDQRLGRVGGASRVAAPGEERVEAVAEGVVERVHGVAAGAGVLEVEEGVVAVVEVTEAAVVVAVAEDDQVAGQRHGGGVGGRGDDGRARLAAGDQRRLEVQVLEPGDVRRHGRRDGHGGLHGGAAHQPHVIDDEARGGLAVAVDVDGDLGGVGRGEAADGDLPPVGAGAGHQGHLAVLVGGQEAHLEVAAEGRHGVEPAHLEAAAVAQPALGRHGLRDAHFGLGGAVLDLAALLAVAGGLDDSDPADLVGAGVDAPALGHAVAGGPVLERWVDEQVVAIGGKGRGDEDREEDGAAQEAGHGGPSGRRWPGWVSDVAVGILRGGAAVSRGVHYMRWRATMGGVLGALRRRCAARTRARGGRRDAAC
ncbi:MAG: hypothetical protein HYU66_20085 [Armatimonadetes bacterium]|nr:hypothetical protein [Armatimonadota bacterium]